MSDIAFFVITLLLFTPIFADQQYDPHNDEWVTVSPDTEYENKYNPHTDEWSLEAADSEIEYNPHTDAWEYQR
tara:strand:+ start:353 stop:571 length:219 start_codon:yes stop_codon:yes gene_type:complete